MPNTKKKRCPNGHEYSPDNTRYRKAKNSSGEEVLWKECIICRTNANKNAKARRRARNLGIEVKDTKINPVPFHNRKSYLYSYACYIARICGTSERAKKLVLEENLRACAPPLPKEEVEGIFDCVERR